jgi:phage terminase small subunit
MRTRLIRPSNANGKLPPRHLPSAEQALWSELQRTYRIDDCAAKELLTQACEARMRARLCRLTVAKEGQTVVDKKGIVRAHPLLQIERSAQASFISALRLLRLDLSGSTEARHPANWSAGAVGSTYSA